MMEAGGATGQGVGPRARKRHERILAAARQLFLRQGVEDSTVDDLLREAGVSRATFYRAFGNMEEVVDALYEDYTAHVLARLEKALPASGSPEAQLDLLLRDTLEDAHAQGPILRVLFREELRPGSRAARFQSRRVQLQVDRIDRWWTQLTGLDSAPELIHCFVLMVQSVTLQVAREDCGPEERERYRASLTYIIQATIQAWRQDAARGSSYTKSS